MSTKDQCVSVSPALQLQAHTIFFMWVPGIELNLDAGKANGIYCDLSPQPLKMAFSDNSLLFN